MSQADNSNTKVKALVSSNEVLDHSGEKLGQLRTKQAGKHKFSTEKEVIYVPKSVLDVIEAVSRELDLAQQSLHAEGVEGLELQAKPIPSHQRWGHFHLMEKLRDEADKGKEDPRKHVPSLHDQSTDWWQQVQVKKHQAAAKKAEAPSPPPPPPAPAPPELSNEQLAAQEAQMGDLKERRAARIIKGNWKEYRERKRKAQLREHGRSNRGVGTAYRGREGDGMEDSEGEEDTGEYPMVVRQGMSAVVVKPKTKQVDPEAGGAGFAAGQEVQEDGSGGVVAEGVQASLGKGPRRRRAVPRSESRSALHDSSGGALLNWPSAALSDDVEGSPSALHSISGPPQAVAAAQGTAAAGGEGPSGAAAADVGVLYTSSGAEEQEGDEPLPSTSTMVPDPTYTEGSQQGTSSTGPGPWSGRVSPSASDPYDRVQGGGKGSNAGSKPKYRNSHKQASGQRSSRHGSSSRSELEQEEFEGGPQIMFDAANVLRRTLDGGEVSWLSALFQQDKEPDMLYSLHGWTAKADLHAAPTSLDPVVISLVQQILRHARAAAAAGDAEAAARATEDAAVLLLRRRLEPLLPPSAQTFAPGDGGSVPMMIKSITKASLHHATSSPAELGQAGGSNTGMEISSVTSSKDPLSQSHFHSYAQSALLKPPPGLPDFHAAKHPPKQQRLLLAPLVPPTMPSNSPFASQYEQDAAPDLLTSPQQHQRVLQARREPGHLAASRSMPDMKDVISTAKPPKPRRPPGVSRSWADPTSLLERSQRRGQHRKELDWQMGDQFVRASNQNGSSKPGESVSAPLPRYALPIKPSGPAHLSTEELLAEAAELVASASKVQRESMGSTLRRSSIGTIARAPSRQQVDPSAKGSPPRAPHAPDAPPASKPGAPPAQHNKAQKGDAAEQGTAGSQGNSPVRLTRRAPISGAAAAGGVKLPSLQAAGSHPGGKHQEPPTAWQKRLAANQDIAF